MLAVSRWTARATSMWRTPGSTADNLLPDTYAIEFEPVGGYSKPARQAVQVSAGAYHSSVGQLPAGSISAVRGLPACGGADQQHQ
jgi:hypothetical protein